MLIKTLIFRVQHQISHILFQLYARPAHQVSLVRAYHFPFNDVFQYYAQDEPLSARDTLEHNAQVLNDLNTPLLWNLTNLHRHGLLQLMNDFGIICIDIVFEVAP